MNTIQEAEDLIRFNGGVINITNQITYTGNNLSVLTVIAYLVKEYDYTVK